MRLYALIPLVFAMAVPAVTASGQEAKKTVAVLRFDNNTGDARYDNLGRALSSMMISDLSVVEEIQLLERERLDELVGELDFQQSVYADPASAQTVGLMVGAEFVVVGAFMSIDPEMRLDTRVASVETSEILKTAEVSGHKDELLALQERLADQLVDGLALALTAADRERLRAQQEANNLGNMANALAFSEALCLMDHGAYLDALDRIREVQRAAPASSIVAATLSSLLSRVEEEAKDALTSRADRAIGGLLGRGRSREAEPKRPPRPAAC